MQGKDTWTGGEESSGSYLDAYGDGLACEFLHLVAISDRFTDR